MNFYDEIKNRKQKIAVVGLGYVGMPIAVALSEYADVIGFDTNGKKIEMYNAGIDPTNEVGNETIKSCTVYFTDDERLLNEASFIIVAVPTPINIDKTPNLSPIIGASEIVGRNLKKNSIVVYESTVYPGVTEDVCINILEKESGLKNGCDFKVGYSPERINPGDKVHRLDNIKKIVSGQDEESLEIIAKIYELVVKVGVHKVSSIKVAEAAKVVENSQRDINIAFMNELAIVFDKMGIDTNEVIEAMNTKWNALGFKPGLVGGHCIGVDPYYFLYEAERLGYHSQIIAAGRKINDSMGEFIAINTIKKLIAADKVVRKSKVVILGITFKENCPDIRNSKVVDIINVLKEYGIKPVVVDPYADKNEVKQIYNVELVDIDTISDADCVIVAVAHDEFKKINLFERMKKNDKKVIIDVKAIVDHSVKDSTIEYWCL